MIASITGILLSKEPPRLVIEAGGVGYEINATQTAYDGSPALGMQYRVFTRLIIREDSQTLYGFSTVGERDLFDLAVGVSGIGPKTALAIVSAIAAPKVREAIIGKDIVTLTAIPGIGKKTAERLIVELRDKLIRDESSSIVDSGDHGKGNVRSEALAALTALGYQRAAAEKAIREVIRTEPKEAETLESLIKAALKQKP